MKILFAPDYRDGNPYQECLAQHLDDVSFLSGYRRLLPLARGTRAADPDILHLHWPEAYFHNHLLRRLRYPIDLRLACAGRKLVVTAHNLFPHRGGDGPLVRRNITLTYRRADAIIAHSEAARSTVAQTFRIDPENVHSIPHGDLSTTIPALVSKREARSHLGLGAEGRICLMFGRADEYKGIEEAAHAWPETSARLAVVGECPDPELAARLRACPKITHLQLERCSEKQLGLWLSAADVTLFNYRQILTSGSACLAHALGIPVLLPARLETIDLPGPGVFRFDELSADLIGQAASSPRAPDPDYLKLTAWSAIAAAHAKIYASL